MLNTFEFNKVLIIAPLRVARDTWPAEIEKWAHLKNLDISIVVGDVKTRIAAVHHPAMIYVVNGENVKWLVEYYDENGKARVLHDHKLEALESSKYLSYNPRIFIRVCLKKDNPQVRVDFASVQGRNPKA